MGNDYDLPKRFCVIATQNPIEYTWTFALPEAQKDRFYAKITLWSPSHELQQKIITTNFYDSIQEYIWSLTQIITLEEWDDYFKKIKNIKINDDVARRFVLFFHFIRESEKILYPISQRWISIFLLACKANAFINERDYVIPEDGLELIEYFLIHRLDIEKSSFSVIWDVYKKSFKNF
jgi:MoxR-like ATPase